MDSDSRVYQTINDFATNELNLFTLGMIAGAGFALAAEEPHPLLAYALVFIGVNIFSRVAYGALSMAYSKARSVA